MFSAEFKFDKRDRAFKLIEINARPWWYVEFASRCGVDVCTMAYRDALGLPVPASDSYQVGCRCVFAVNDLRGWRGESRNQRSLWSFLATWLGCDSAPFHWNDPKPALHYLRQTMAAIFESGSHAKIPKKHKPQPQSEDRQAVATPRARTASLAK